MDDGSSAEQNGASESISLKNGASEEAPFFKKLISHKNGVSEEAIFYQRKKRKTDVIFRLKKNWCLQTKMERRNKKVYIFFKLLFPKKLSGDFFVFNIKISITVKSEWQIRHP